MKRKSTYAENISYLYSFLSMVIACSSTLVYVVNFSR